jgi:hypothetical protein
MATWSAREPRVELVGEMDEEPIGGGYDRVKLAGES